MDWNEKAKEALAEFHNGWMREHFPKAKPIAYVNMAKTGQSYTALYLAGVRAGLEAAELMLEARQDEISDATAHNTINGCILRLSALMPETKGAT